MSIFRDAAGRLSPWTLFILVYLAVAWTSPLSAQIQSLPKALDGGIFVDPDEDEPDPDPFHFVDPDEDEPDPDPFVDPDEDEPDPDPLRLETFPLVVLEPTTVWIRTAEGAQVTVMDSNGMPILILSGGDEVVVVLDRGRYEVEVAAESGAGATWPLWIEPLRGR